MSNKLFQSVLYQMKETTERALGVADESGTIIATSELSQMGKQIIGIKEELIYTDERFVLSGYTYQPLLVHGKVEYLVFVSGEDALAASLASMIAVSLSQIKEMYDEKHDKASFIKNIILDNILPSDIYVKAKELRLNNDVPRILYLIKFIDRGDVVPIDAVQNMFPDRNHDYVISVGESDVVLVRELKNPVDSRENEKLAKTIVDTAGSEFYVKVVVGIGTVVDTVKDLARSYKEAQVSIEVGKVFDIEKSVINYENLGIGRLIYQLPTTLCDMFLHEVFRKGTLESLDRETLITIQAFFENNLNVSETSRKLFVHRNTLVYRLEKIKKLTGLDLREFEHAITFKVALMVKKYLSSKPVKY